MQRETALDKICTRHLNLLAAQAVVEEERATFAKTCIEAHEAGIPDREIAELTGYSRARIQQFRCGDPRSAARVG
jgi:hypothetical protein